MQSFAAQHLRGIQLIFEVFWDIGRALVLVLAEFGRFFTDPDEPLSANPVGFAAAAIFVAVCLLGWVSLEKEEPQARRRVFEEEVEEVEDAEEDEEIAPCAVCGGTDCYECQLFLRMDWASFVSGERIIELEEPIRDEERLRQFILEKDPAVEMRIRFRSYYAEGECHDETKVVLRKYSVTKSANKKG
jgi:hypothetical protein